MKSLIKTLSLASSALLAITLISATSFAAPEEGKAKGKGPSFERFDADESGTLSMEEFINPRLKGAERRFSKEGASAEDVAARLDGMKTRLSKAFARADKDESGELSKEEFQTLAMMGGKGGKKSKKNDS